MSQQSIESLLSPIDEESPAGENLEYDPQFLELERTAAPKAERAIGDSVKAAEEPDWEKVAELAEAVLGRTKDLRVAVPLATAWMQISGFLGCASGLALIRGLLENFWDDLHPQLDADDDNDPTLRVNSLATLSDPQGILRYVRAATFVQSPRLGRFSLRDLRIANGTLKTTVAADDDDAGSAPPPTLIDIEACCKDCDVDQLSAVTTAVGETLDHVRAIDTIFTGHIGVAGPDLKLLIGDLSELKKFLDPQLAQRLPQTTAEGESDEAPDDAAAVTAGHSSAASSGRISNREDVVRRLEEVCSYYAEREPSSPVPLLLRRAQRLVHLDFADLIKDLAPSGISQLQVIVGASGSDGASASAIDDDDDD